MNMSLAPGDTFLRIFAGIAMRPLLSAEYEYRPLNEDMKKPPPEVLDFIEENSPHIPHFSPHGTEI
jgi:hypothetical protein